MKPKQLFFTAMVAVSVAMSLIACKKNDSVQAPAGQQNLTLYLTDGPGFFDKVLIDIRSVQVLVDTGKNTRRNDTSNWDRIGSHKGFKDSSLVWQNLNVKAGIYDILNLRNGVDTLLAATGIPKGAIRLIKIEIGTNNTVVKDSVTYPINWPSNVPNYILIKLKGHEVDEYLPGKIRLWLDFDVSRSVHQEGNKFFLRPFFHFFVEKKTASVSGKVKPNDAKAVLTLFNSTDTAYALPNKDGHFKMRGLKDGTYSLYINASNGFRDTTLTNVKVMAPKETELGTIQLRN